MKRLLLINSVCGIGSTGRICADIAREYEAKGYEVRIAYGRSNEIGKGAEKYAVRIGTKADVYAHVAYTRLFDKHGLASKRATKNFLKWADGYNPDVLWLHNIHGYYINYEMLFDWIKKRQKKQSESGDSVMDVKWTLHDCWAFTGHCSHFTFIGCKKWMSECRDCPQKKEYPAGIFKDGSKFNYQKKKQAFTGVMKLEIFVPSEWLKTRVNKSFLNHYSIIVQHNSINYSVFKPVVSDFREQNGLKDKIIVLGVASVWNTRKGLDDLMRLSELLDEKYQLVIVGLTDKQIRNLPKNIIGLPRTHSPEKLAELYSVADIFVNPSVEETFGMTTMEAQACGTYTIVYKGTACEEISVGDKGCSVYPGAEKLKEAIENLFQYAW